MIPFDGLIWFCLTLVALALLQRLLHREIQSVFLIVSRSPEFTTALFAVIFLPGVLLHELSHYVAALILGVPAAGFSLVPRTLPGGRLQLGYVETVRTDVVRDSLIGAAPLLSGGLVVALIALTRFDLLPLWEALLRGQIGSFWQGVRLLPGVPDFPLWFYLLFAVSSTMLPSRSDRHAWLPLGLGVLILLAVAGLAGAGSWMIANVSPWVNTFLSATSVVFGLSALVHATLIVPVGVLHFLLARVTGVDVG